MQLHRRSTTRASSYQNDGKKDVDVDEGKEGVSIHPGAFVLDTMRVEQSHRGKRMSQESKKDSLLSLSGNLAPRGLDVGASTTMCFIGYRLSSRMYRQ
ncbi:nck-associated protein 1-like isoform X1 [Anopheles sinensis]|uniref:Nck-associated protein 1-like isoform X1 n=1 Tax=Anopheles sinensis TaxID=74873 RepID=A0A084W4I7_ANOSI|nr:nck-associated protein 1-like isoform X1 [Anopheles sinensis]